MAFVLLSRSRSKTQGSVKPALKRRSARGQHSTDLRFGFGKPVFQPSAAALPTAPVIQTKLKVGEPNDKLEQEADRVAGEVMRMPEALPPGTAISTSAETTTALIQHGLGDVNESNDQISLKKEDKAELEFHSALHFNRTFRGFNADFRSTN